MATDKDREEVKALLEDLASVLERCAVLHVRFKNRSNMEAHDAT